MRSFSSELNEVIIKWGPQAISALKRSRNKGRFRVAVERTWRSRPDIARFVLMHTNGIYIAKDEHPRKGPDKDRAWWVFGIYMDDAMARTEVDAWQSVLFQSLHREGLSIDELRILPAKWDMRKRKLFPELWEEYEENPFLAENWSLLDESRMLDTVKRAVFLVFEDIEQAWAFLEKVQGATIQEMSDEDPNGAFWLRDGKRHGDKRYRLILYVEDVPAMQHLVGAFGEAIRSRARLLGLRLSSIWVNHADERLAGQHAFCRVGRSIPLGDMIPQD